MAVTGLSVARSPISRRGPKRAGLTLITVGAVAAATCLTIIGIRIGPALAHSLTGTSYATPMDQRVSLTRGKWVVFQRTGSQTGGGGVSFTDNNAVTLAPMI